MTPEQQDRVESLFKALCDTHPGERERTLARVAQEDAEVHAELKSLLDHHDALEAGNRGEGAAADLPERIAGHRIRRVLGTGAMGVVYEAEQEHPHRTVALKVLRHGFSSATVRRRFELEAEVLGRLDHPGIARIYEAGTDEAGGAPPQPVAGGAAVEEDHVDPGEGIPRLPQHRP